MAVIVTRLSICVTTTLIETTTMRMRLVGNKRRSTHEKSYREQAHKDSTG